MVGIRRIINADKLKEVIDMPDELKGKKVELIVLPLINEEQDIGIEKEEKKFLKLFSNPIKVGKIFIPSRDELHERKSFY